MPNTWWQNHNVYSLDSIIAKLNLSREKHSSIEACRHIFEALNLLWNAFRRYKKSDLPEDVWSDSNSMTLLLESFEDKTELLNSKEVEALAKFEPAIMNMDVLKKENYDPNSISEKLRKKAEEEHRKFKNTYIKYFKKRDTLNQDALVKRLAAILFVVRSNLAHGEKTLNGPDLKKIKRDANVCNVMRLLLDFIFELLFNKPSTYLAVYGTLAPGQPNEHLLKDILGDWNDGEVDGNIIMEEGLPYFEWVLGSKIAVKIFHSQELPKHFEKIDKFEGRSYARIWVPIRANGSLNVVNIYEKSH